MLLVRLLRPAALPKIKYHQLADLSMAETKEVYKSKLADSYGPGSDNSPDRQLAEADTQLTDPSSEVDKKRQVRQSALSTTSYTSRAATLTYNSHCPTYSASSVLAQH